MASTRLLTEATFTELIAQAMRVGTQEQCATLCRYLDNAPALGRLDKAVTRISKALASGEALTLTQIVQKTQGMMSSLRHEALKHMSEEGLVTERLVYGHGRPSTVYSRAETRFDADTLRAALADGPITMADIADTMGSPSKARLAAVLNELEGLGEITREPFIQAGTPTALISPTPALREPAVA